MISKQQFDQMEVGNIFEAGELLKGLTDEKIVWKCVGVRNEPVQGKDRRILEFALYFYDCLIGFRYATLNKQNRVSINAK